MRLSFVLRKVIPSDISLFQQCFDNKEFAHNIGEVDPMKIISLKSPHVVLIVSILKQNEKCDIGFCSFYHQETGSYLYLGGIHPKYFDSGYGLYASIAVLSYMFDVMEADEINTVVYNYNKRSLRMLLSIGFIETKTENNLHVLKLGKKVFPNEFAKLIKQKIDYQVNSSLHEI